MNKVFLVLDTNVLVSALINPNGKPASIFRRFIMGEFQLFLDERIFFEYQEVLNRPKFKFEPTRIAFTLSYIRSHSCFVAAPKIDIPFTDEKDRKYFEVAKFTGAILVIGNTKHYPDDPIIKTVQDI